MKLRLARSYFEGLCESLGYKKHYDGFAINNLPSSKFNQAYHVSAFTFNGSTQNQSLDVEATVTVRLYFKAYRDVDTGIQAATDGAEAYIEEALASENRLSQLQSFKNVVLDQIQIEPYSESNDNSVVCRMEFRVFYYLGIC